jgi:hypothetical protein
MLALAQVTLLTAKYLTGLCHIVPVTHNMDSPSKLESNEDLIKLGQTSLGIISLLMKSEITN